MMFSSSRYLSTEKQLAGQLNQLSKAELEPKVSSAVGTPVPNSFKPETVASSLIGLTEAVDESETEPLDAARERLDQSYSLQPEPMMSSSTGFENAVETKPEYASSSRPFVSTMLKQPIYNSSETKVTTRIVTASGSVITTTSTVPLKSSRPEPKDPLQRLRDWRLMRDEITRIITRRLPEDKRNHYSIRQINKQAAIYQSFMYHYKLNYEAFLDKSTLEERVIRCANMAMGRDLRGLKRPRLIVKINVEKDYC